MLYFNGIDGVSGDYLVPPLRADEAASFLTRAAGDHEVDWLLRRVSQAAGEAHLGLPQDVDPVRVEQAGWGLVLSPDETPEVREALAPLVEHRRRQIGDERRIKVLDYRPGESRAQWLARHGVGAGSLQPEKVPYYLLVVGSPEKIPFSFLHLLGVEYSVGCLHFDSAADYARYADSVVRYETAPAVPNARELVFFATCHDSDPATQLMADHLLAPLSEGIPESPAVAGRRGFHSRRIWKKDATKSALAGILEPPAGAPPAVLFTATHGVGFPRGHASQTGAQGALLCQDWPGPGTVDPGHYFTAADLSPEARVHGLIAFHFACYSAGTPARDRYFHKPGTPPPVIADRPFLAALPKALLSHPAGGALAVIGHVDRAWGYSFVTLGAGAQRVPFENTLGRILAGEPVGYAVKDFSERYAALATSLSSLLEEVGFGAQIPESELVEAWVERNDAEGYVVLGDPAVRLRTADLQRPAGEASVPSMTYR